VEAKSIVLHDPLTLVLWILAVEKINDFKVLSADQ
jgi:hypothetical protein